MKPNPSPVASSVRKKFLDFFQRPNTTSEEGLGIADDGSRWDVIRGLFKVNFERLETETDNSEYPIASVVMPSSNIDVRLIDVDNGSAAALWITDAGNWYAVGVDQHSVDCNCEVGTECNRWNSSNITGWTTTETGGRNAYQAATGQFCTGGNLNTNRGNSYQVLAGRPDGPYFGCRRYIFPGACVEWYTYYVNNYSTRWNATTYSYNTRTCNTNFTTRYNSPNFSSNINGYNAKTCNRWNEFTFNCETCYPQWIRIIQSIAGTVTELAKISASEVVKLIKSPNETLDLYVQDEPITRFVKALFLRTRNETITISAYSDPGSLEQISLNEEGDFVYTPTGATVTNRFGISFVPSEYNEEKYIGGVDISRENL